MSGPTDDDWKKITKLVDQFYNRADAEPFRAPVDWKALGLIDYPKIIQNPMDLGTIRDRLKNAKKKGHYYKNLLQVSNDVHLVWTNCTLYNADGSDFFKLATSLRKKWEDRFQKVLGDCSPGAKAGGGAASSKPKKAPDKGLGGAGTSAFAAAAPGAGLTGMSIGAPQAPKISIQERRAFAKSLYQLNKEDLGKVILELDAKCPGAIRRNSAEDELELNVDKIGPPSILAELKALVEQCNASSTQRRQKSTSGASNKKAKTK